MADDYAGWSDQQRMEAYRACRMGVEAANNKPGEAALIALAQGDIPGYLAAWFNMFVHDYDDAGPCDRFLTRAQHDAVMAYRAADRDDKLHHPGYGVGGGHGPT